MDAGRSKCRTALLTAALLALAVASPAGAATVQKTAFGIQVTDSGSEQNALSVELVAGQIRVRDTVTAPTAASIDCTESGGDVFCPDDVRDVFASLGGGNDTITFGDGLVASVDGGDGEDEITGADGADSLLGGSQNDRIAGGAGTDQIEGGGGNDILRGGAGNDFFNSFVGGGPDPVIDTDPGNDDLDGEGGSDSLNGGTGGDVMTDTGNDGAKDEVHYGRGDHESAVGVNVTMASGRNDGNSPDGLFDDVGAGIEQVVGTGARDELTGSAGADTLRGRDGDDRLAGGTGSDTLTGGAGNDTLEAREGVADASLDCDDTSGSQGTSDTAVVDAADPAPVRCEVVERPATGGSTSPPPAAAPTQTTGPQPPRTAGRPVVVRSGARLTCQPGAWSAAPTFAYAWFAAGVTAPLGTGPAYTLVPADAGRLVYCLVAARSAGGTGVARSVLLSIPAIVTMPELQFRTESFSRERLMKLTNGAITLTTKRKAKRNIDCALGGTKGSEAACSTAAARTARKKLDPGDVYVTTPKDGKTLEADPATGALPRVSLGIYDRSLDDKLPPVATKRKFGDDCPLTGPGFTSGDEKAFIAGLQGKYESVARAALDQRECLFKIRDSFRRDQESDPYVASLEGIEIDDRRGLRVTVARNRQADLAVIPYHRRLEGRDDFAGVDISRGEINPGLGSDGDLTTLVGNPNDLCFHVREASTGRPVPGVVVRATGPDGRLVADRVSLREQGGGTDENGNRCDRWRIEERGEYRFTFDYRGTNGINEEGSLRIDAVSRARDSYTTISGRKLECVVDRCVQTGTATPRARQAVVIESVILVAAVSVLVKQIIDANTRGGDRPAALRTGQALAGGDPEVSLFRAAGSGGVTPGFLTTGGKLAPAASIISGGAGNIISGGAGNIISGGAGNIISGGAGNIVANDGATISAPPGGALTSLAGAGIISGGAGNIVANDGATIVSGGAGNLIGQDGAGVVSGGAGNLTARGGEVVQIGERSVITEGGRLAPGTLVAVGAAAGIPVAPIISGGAGNLIGQDGAG